jgi:rhomboid protease GluP
VENEIDFTAHTEAELVEMFGRMDPRYAPEQCAKLAQLLADRGYLVTDGGLGPGYAVPSPTQLLTLIGSSEPVSWEVDFGTGKWLSPAQNDLHRVGRGRLTVDGMSVWISGRRSPQGPVREIQLPYRSIVNVESRGQWVRFEYQGADIDHGAITVRLADESAALQLLALLPKVRTGSFRPQIQADEEFTRALQAQSTRTPVTVALIAINALVFIGTLLSGAGWLSPAAAVQLAWGSNFGPYTTDGEWWRLVTSLFIHFGIVHLAANMIALAYFCPLVERLYGSVNYLFLYLLAGVGGSLASIAWHPAVNSAGASGAIFGMLGALLATLLRARNTFPRDILRPIGRWALVFLLWNLYAGLRGQGVDYAAHLGGLTTGLLLGLTAVRPVTGERSYTLGDLRRLLRAVAVAAAVLAGGLWWAQTAATALAGDALYWHTVHWLRDGELSVNRRFNETLALTKAGKPNQRALADEVDRDVVPFWQEASARLAAITLPPSSPNPSHLQLLRDVSDGRARAYGLLSKGLRANDSQEIAAAEQELKRVEEILKTASR